MKVISMFIVFIHYVFQESSSVRVCTQMNVSVHGEIADFLRGGENHRLRSCEFINLYGWKLASLTIAVVIWSSCSTY